MYSFVHAHWYRKYTFRINCMQYLPSERAFSFRYLFFARTPRSKFLFYWQSNAHRLLVYYYIGLVRHAQNTYCYYHQPFIYIYIITMMIIIMILLLFCWDKIPNRQASICAPSEDFSSLYTYTYNNKLLSKIMTLDICTIIYVKIITINKYIYIGTCLRGCRERISSIWVPLHQYTIWYQVLKFIQVHENRYGAHILKYYICVCVYSSFKFSATSDGNASSARNVRHLLLYFAAMMMIIIEFIRCHDLIDA